jgi:hypothetical protein
MTDDAPATVAIPHPYTAEDIDRGYTVTKGEGGREQRRAVPIDVLRLVEARRLNAILARLVGRWGKEG